MNITILKIFFSPYVGKPIFYHFIALLRNFFEFIGIEKPIIRRGELE